MLHLTTMNFLFQLLVVTWLCFYEYSGTFARRSFIIDYENNQFLKDGKPYRYIAGSMHYFRIPNEYWPDRLMKLKAAGLNAVETYVPWNVHQPTENDFLFEGNADLIRFIKLSQNFSLDVILRMGPYICAEFEFGGLPWWLLKTPRIGLRVSDYRFLDFVKKYYEKLLPMLVQYLHKNGGPIISMQIENEYGSRPMCDKVYLLFLRNLFRRYVGKDFVLFTTDGPTVHHLACGYIPEVYPTVDFGASSLEDVKKAFIAQRVYAPHGPLVNSEFYSGWLDLWGSNHSTVETMHILETMKYMWDLGASFSFYMFHGGSNFGYMNGASWTNQPSTQSYDYDAPLNEAGDPTDKYYAIRDKIDLLTRRTCATVPNPTLVPLTSQKIAYGKIDMNYLGRVTDVLDILCQSQNRVITRYPKTMEEINFGYGFVLYETKLRHCGRFILRMDDLSDRAYVMVNGIVQGIIHNWEIVELEISTVSGGNLYILVENMGRENMVGPRDPKGIIGNVTLNDELLEYWTIYPLTIENVYHEVKDYEKRKKLKLRGNNYNLQTNGHFSPAIYYSVFRVPILGDTFLNPTNWSKGQFFMNDFNVGRYWPTLGPQVTLYVPKPILKTENVIIMFELEHPGNCYDFLNTKCTVYFTDKPILNKTVN